MIAEEKAVELFLKYFRICNDESQAKESATIFATKFITAEEEVEYWTEVVIAIDLINK